LPYTLISEIKAQFRLIENLHERDLKAGYAGAFLFGRLEQKYKNAAKEFIWQWFFPAFTLTHVPETGEKMGKIAITLRILHFKQSVNWQMKDARKLWYFNCCRQPFYLLV